jgi:Domain of unknown function (DUF4203)
MLPPSYQLPAAALLVVGGVVSCFAGYRLFKVVLGIYGFILGAMMASSMMGVTNTTGMVVAALVGGIAGSLILVFAYYVGIALIGAGLGALVAHVGWGWIRPGDPPAVGLIVLAVLGAILAMILQRYVIIVSTAFGGAWTLILGVAAIAGDRASRAITGSAAWILYPLSPAPGQRWVTAAWLLLGVLGAAAQVGVTGKKK